MGTDSLPSELIKHVTAICGSEGEAWLKLLPQTIDELEKLWSVCVHQAFPGVEFNFVAPAIADHEGRCVVKIAPPFKTTEIFSEAKYLKTRDGSGAVRLLAEDRQRRAILIEHALPGEALFQHFKNDPAASVAPAVEVLRTVLRKPPADLVDVQTLDKWFGNFQRYRETDFPPAHAEKAFEIYERLSVQPGRTFYLHGDFHPGNIVTADRAPYLAIDPKGLIGHIGYDIAVFLNNLHWWRKKDTGVNELLAAAVEQFGNAFAIDKKELLEWAYACMVIGNWWTVEDMPEHFEGEAAFSDVWEV